MSRSACVLDDAARRLIVRVIGEHQDYLESEINALVVPGTLDAMPHDRNLLARARRRWKRAEDAVKLIEGRI